MNALYGLGFLIDGFHLINLLVGHGHLDFAGAFRRSFFCLALASKDDGRLLQIVVVFANAVYAVTFQHCGNFFLCLFVGHVVCFCKFVYLGKRRHNGCVLCKSFHRPVFVHPDATITEEVCRNFMAVFGLTY